jgi:hypothetical protein
MIAKIWCGGNTAFFKLLSVYLQGCVVFTTLSTQTLSRNFTRNMNQLLPLSLLLLFAQMSMGAISTHDVVVSLTPLHSSQTTPTEYQFTVQMDCLDDQNGNVALDSCCLRTESTMPVGVFPSNVAQV